MSAQAVAEIIHRDSEPGAIKTCESCGESFIASPPLLPFLAKWIRHCEACGERIRQQDSERLVREAEANWKKAKAAPDAERNEAWSRFCPPKYQQTNPAKLPLPALLARVMQWKYGPRGLLLHGATGLGKSRCAWKLIEREFMAGRQIEVLNHSVAFEFMGLFANSPSDADKWMKRVSHAPLLLIDDSFKAKQTDALEAALFSIIATRDDYDLPIVATLNDTGDSLRGRMTADRGDAFVRRLRENCETVPFV
jgi:DNA replication protein DnaC